jgi:hypothetical protein
MSYFDVVPKGFDVKGMNPIERAISIAEYCGKYDCFLPTSEAGVCDLWSLVYDGWDYFLYQNNEFIYSCDSRDDIASYLESVL